MPHQSCGSVARAHLPRGVRSLRGEMMTQLGRCSLAREARLQLSQSCQSKSIHNFRKSTANVDKSNVLCFKFFCKITYLVIISVPHYFWALLKLPLIKAESITAGHWRLKQEQP